MDTAKVIDTAQQEKGIGDGFLSASQVMSAPRQRSQVGAESAIETLNESRVNRAIALGEVREINQHGTGARQNIAGNVKVPVPVSPG